LFAIVLLLAAGFTPPAWAADIPRARVLEGELPGLDQEVTKILRQAVAAAGYEIDSVSADSLCDAGTFAKARCNLLVIPNGRVLPMASIRVVEHYLNAGGQMIVCGLPLWEDGAAKVAALGIGHSAAYLLAAFALAVGLSRRTGHALVPDHLVRTLAVAVGVGALSWLAMRALAPQGRLETLAVTAVVGGAATAIYVTVLRVAGARLSLRPAAGHS